MSLAQERRSRGLYPGRVEPAKQFQLREEDRLLERGGGRKAGIEGAPGRLLRRKAGTSHVSLLLYWPNAHCDRRRLLLVTTGPRARIRTQVPPHGELLQSRSVGLKR